MANKRSEMAINTGLRALLEQIKYRFEGHENDLGSGPIERLINALDALYTAETTCFDENGDIIEAQHAKYNNICKEVKTAFKVMADFIADKHQVNDAIKELLETGESLMPLIIPEVSPYAKDYFKPWNWNINEEQVLLRDQTLQQWAADLEANNNVPQLSPYGEDEYSNRIRNEIKLLGDVNDFASYYAQNKNKLSPEEVAYIKGHAQTAMFYDKLEADSKTQKHEPVFGVIADENGNIELTGYENQYQYQNTANGCWSCAYDMMLKSRGVSLDQRLIRAFRPKMNLTQSSAVARSGQGKGLTADVGSNPSDLADLTQKVLPNTAMNMVSITGFNELTPELKNRCAEEFKNVVRDALSTSNCPVALNYNGHFVSIVGMNGNDFKVLDSISRKPNMIETVSIDTILNTASGASLTWLSNLQPTAERTCEGIPKIFKAEYSDNTLVSPTELEGINQNARTLDATTFIPLDPQNPNMGGIPVNHTIYLPENLTDPAALQNANNEQPSFSQKEYKIKTDIDADIERDLAVFNKLSAVDTANNEAGKNEVIATQKRILGMMLAHKCLRDDLKADIEDKRIIQRTLKHCSNVASAIEKLEGFDAFYNELQSEGGPLFENANLSAASINDIYERFANRFDHNKMWLKGQVIKASNNDIKPEHLFSSQILTDELKGISKQIAKADEIFNKELNTKYKEFTNVAGELTRIFSKCKGQDVEADTKAFNRLFGNFSKLAFERRNQLLNAGQKLTTSQIQELKLLNRMSNAYRFARLKMKPEDIVQYKLAEKLLSIQATNLNNTTSTYNIKKCLGMLCNTAKHDAAVKKILDSPRFAALTHDKNGKLKSLKDLQKLVKSDNNEIFKLFNNSIFANRTPQDIVNQNIEFYNTHNVSGTAIKDMFYGKFMRDNNMALNDDPYTRYKNLEDSLEANRRGLMVDRSALTTLSICRMVEMGYTMEQIFDTQSLLNEKAEVFKEVYNLVNTNTPDTSRRIGQIYANGFQRLYDQLSDGISLNVDFTKNDCLFQSNTKMLPIINDVIYDAWQEMSREEFKKHAQDALGGVESFNVLTNQMKNTAAVIKVVADGPSTALNILNTKQNDQGGYYTASEVVKQLMVPKYARELFLDEKIKNPNADIMSLMTEKLQLQVRKCSGDISEKFGDMDYKDGESVNHHIEEYLGNENSRKVLAQKVLSGEMDKQYTFKSTLNKQTKELDFSVDNPEKLFGKLIPKEPVAKQQQAGGIRI